MDEVTVRNMSAGELAVAVEWAAREGWNPGRDDAAAFFAADSDGFFCAEADGEIVGTISAVAYGRDFGFVGFYIVKPERRGHRDGLLLAEHAMARLAGRCIGIDGVLAKQRQYAKFYGFEFAYRNLRYGGPVAAGAVAPGIRPAGEVPFEAIAGFDRRFFPADRAAFLRAWLSMPHAKALVWVEESGAIGGLGVIRECRQGFKVGPLFAEEAGVAEALFHALCRDTGDQPVYVDVPELNVAAVDLAERHGMKEVFATARMYHGGAPDLPLDGIFGVTTFELG